MISRALLCFFQMYNLLIIIRILLSWVPSIDWDSEPFRWTRSVTDPVLGIFRNIIPPFNGLDFSPVLAIIVLQIVEGIILRMVSII